MRKVIKLTPESQLPVRNQRQERAESSSFVKLAARPRLPVYFTFQCV